MLSEQRSWVVFFKTIIKFSVFWISVSCVFVQAFPLAQKNDPAFGICGADRCVFGFTRLERSQIQTGYFDRIGTELV